MIQSPPIVQGPTEMHRRACLTLIGSAVAAFADVERAQALRLRSEQALRLPSALDSTPGEPELVAESRLDAEDEVRQAEAARFQAMLKRDAATLARLLAPELSYTHGDGRLVDKASFIAELESGDFQYVSIQPSGVTVRVFDDTAIVTGTAGMRVVNEGSPADIRIVYTNTHLRRLGAWQMVAWHATRVAR